MSRGRRFGDLLLVILLWSWLAPAVEWVAVQIGRSLALSDLVTLAMLAATFAWGRRTAPHRLQNGGRSLVQTLAGPGFGVLLATLAVLGNPLPGVLGLLGFLVGRGWGPDLAALVGMLAAWSLVATRGFFAGARPARRLSVDGEIRVGLAGWLALALAAYTLTPAEQAVFLDRAVGFALAFMLLSLWSLVWWHQLEQVAREGAAPRQQVLLLAAMAGALGAVVSLGALFSLLAAPGTLQSAARLFWTVFGVPITWLLYGFAFVVGFFLEGAIWLLRALFRRGDAAKYLNRAGEGNTKTFDQLKEGVPPAWLAGIFHWLALGLTVGILIWLVVRAWRALQGNDSQAAVAFTEVREHLSNERPRHASIRATPPNDPVRRVYWRVQTAAMRAGVKAELTAEALLTQVAQRAPAPEQKAALQAAVVLRDAYWTVRYGKRPSPVADQEVAKQGKTLLHGLGQRKRNQPG